ncbi:MAG: nucleotidyltransferase family protein [Candidatus Aminicenantes bacterium]|nr:nucleotidyltransferase family protein [Candidatus Aminicenantes bacterium]
MKTLEEIKKVLDSHRQVLKDKYKVKNIGIFGSYVRGEHRAKSDLDVLVEYDSPVSLLQIVALENHLTALLGVKVDLVPRRNIRKELKESILKETVLV